MAYVKAQLEVLQQIAATGLPLVGGRVSAYVWDTVTAQAMYTSSAGAGSATYFTLNSLGQPQSAGGTAVDIFLDDTKVYKFIITDSNSTQVGPVIGPVYPGGVASLESFASMEAVRTSETTRDYIETQAFYAAGTTGGAKLYRDGTGTPTGSGADVIAAALAAGTFCNAAGVCYKLKPDQRITLEMFGVVADGDGAGSGTDNAATLQVAFAWLLDGNHRSLYGSPEAIYRSDTGITCQRSSANHNEFIYFNGQNCKFDFTNITASGTNMLVGATSSTYFAEQGGIVLANFRIIGNEINNASPNTTTDTPTGSRTGLGLVYASRVLLWNVYSNWHRVGVFTAFCFPLVQQGGSFRNNFVGHLADDSSNLQQWNNPTFNACRYGIAIVKTNAYGSGRIDNITYNSPWLESCLVGVHIDPSSDSGTPRIRRIKVNDGYYKSITYDTYRIGIAWDFATPETRGADRVGQVYGVYVNDGSHRGGVTSATSANFVFPTTATVREFFARASIEESANSVVNSPAVGTLTYTDDESTFGTEHKTVYWGSKDYEEGTWTPVLTFQTPGDLARAYTYQIGTFTKVGRMVKLTFRVETSSFTHTTASGDLRITGLPYAVRTLADLRFGGTTRWSGITKAGYTQVNTTADSGNSYLTFQASGSGVGVSSVSSGNVPTGGTVVLEGEITYEAAE